MKAVALYARVSSERQAQQATIDSQLIALKQRATNDGHVVLPNDTYVDDGYSGSTLRRPALERLRDRIAEGSIDILYVHSPDRLARRYAHQVLLLEEFAAHRVQVVLLNDRNGATAEDELLVQVQGVIAEYERAKILERSRRGKLHKARQGIVNPLAGAPYGYRYIKRSDTTPASYHVSLPEAKVVRRIFNAVVREQRTLGQVARMLNEDGVPTKGRSPRWTVTAIHEVLGNPAYMGKAAFGKTESVERATPLRLTKRHVATPRYSSSRPRCSAEWIFIDVPPIISAENFAAAREQLERNRIQAQRNRRPGKYLLAGLTVCVECGYAFYGRTNQKTEPRRGRVEYVYYKCAGAEGHRFPDGPVCSNRPVRREDLEEHVWSSVAALLRDPARVIAEWSRRTRAIHTKDQHETERAEALRSIKAHERALQRLLDAYEHGALELTELKDRSERLRTKLAHAKGELEALDKRIAQRRELTLVLDRVEDFARRVRDGLERVTWDQRRAILTAVVARIEIDKDSATIVYRLPSSSTSSRLHPPPKPASAAEVADCVGGVLTGLIR